MSLIVDIKTLSEAETIYFICLHQRMIEQKGRIPLLVKSVRVTRHRGLIPVSGIPERCMLLTGVMKAKKPTSLPYRVQRLILDNSNHYRTVHCRSSFKFRALRKQFSDTRELFQQGKPNGASVSFPLHSQIARFVANYL